MVEHSTADREVTGSNPVAPLLLIIFFNVFLLLFYFLFLIVILKSIE